MSESQSPAVRIQPRRSAPGLGGGAPRRLPRDLVERANKRLASATLMCALAFATAFPVMNLSPPESMGNLAIANIVAAVCTIFALGAYALTRTKIEPDRLLDFGLVFEVVMGFGIAFAETFATYSPNASVRGVSWLCVFIVIFPLIVPSTPGKTFIASVATATMSPIALVIIIALGAPAPSMVTFLYLVLPTYFAAGLAVLCTRIINRLTSDVERARRMGSYQLVQMLGRGGMGEVWRAKHRMLARPAAIKLVNAEVLAGREGSDVLTLKKRFEREAQVTASLTSPHTIQLFDFGITDDGTLYYVMEMLNGVDCETLVRDHGPVPPERAAHILRQVAESLAEAHEAGLVHRDIKPANIYLCRLGGADDHVKVLDFGLVAHTTGVDNDETRLTADGTVTGTPAYMAPEMITGDRELDNRTDLYSLGCVGYWLLTAQLVFTGTPVQVVYGHVEKEPTPPSSRVVTEIPSDLERLVLACLSKEPGARPMDARQFIRRLAECDLTTWTNDDATAWWAEHRRDPAPASLEVDEYAETVLPVQSESL